MKEKIKLWFAEKYSSSPKEISNEKIEFILKKDCECDDCLESIFKMDDFPEIDIENNELLCEDCYEEKYIESCIICDEIYYSNELSNEFPKSPFYYIGVQNKPGIYHALSYPVFSAATGGLGDTYIWWNNVEFICSIEDFLNSYDPKFESDLSEKWKTFIENINIEFGDFIGPCCYEIALEIQNLKKKET